MTEMTEGERRRFESLEALRAAAYASFNDRRATEWKLSLSIWTALAILLAGLVQPVKLGEIFPLKGTLIWLVFAFGGLVLVLLHFLWSDWESRANSLDKDVLLHFRNEMVNKTLNLPFSEDLERKIKEHSNAVGWRKTSHLVQVLITALLALAVVLILCVRS